VVAFDVASQQDLPYLPAEPPRRVPRELEVPLTPCTPRKLFQQSESRSRRSRPAPRHASGLRDGGVGSRRAACSWRCICSTFRQNER